MSLSRSSRIGPRPSITKPQPPLRHFRHPGRSFATAADKRVTKSLTACSPSNAPETPIWEGAAPARAGTAWVSTGAVPYRGMPTVGAPHTPANKEPPSRETTATHGRKNPTNPSALAQSHPPPTGISSVAGCCSSSYSYSPGLRTE
ncbi:hypothetical protein chiPu_0025455 [Chiloscyllium punctatum]|uniref:Uncharacterized protein n=1 Tax=Chiloscyllium punctatum TaxID=137246 RepID=A0A401TEG1_CHIPU|nr:hypothetical protein [Chiloscyllium punctatum]